MTKYIGYITIGLFIILAGLSLILSYNGLHTTALNNGKAGLLAYIWPVLIDGGLVIFSLSVVYQTLRGERATVQWILVGLFTVATISFNIFQAQNEIVAWIVAGSAPLVLFLAFESLMNMLVSGVKRSGFMEDLDTLKAEIKAKATELDSLNRKIERLTVQAGELGQTITLHTLSDRQQELCTLIKAGQTNKTTLAETLGVSRSTVYSDLKELEQAGIVHENGNGLEVVR